MVPADPVGTTSPESDPASAQAGKSADSTSSEVLLSKLASSLVLGQHAYTDIGKRLKLSVEQRNWEACNNTLTQFAQQLIASEAASGSKATVPASTAPSIHDKIAMVDLSSPASSDAAQVILLKDLLIRTLMLALPNLLSAVPELAAESEMLAGSLRQAITDKPLQELATKLKNLCFKIEHLTPPAAATLSPPATDGRSARLANPAVKDATAESAAESAATPAAVESAMVSETDPMTTLLSKLLSLTLSMAVSTLLHNTPDLAKTSDQLSSEIKLVDDLNALQAIESRMKTLFLQISLNAEDSTEQLQLLLGLFQLLLENVGNLLEDDNWLRGQVLVIKELITGHIDHRTLIDATRSLKEVIYKQGELKDCIAQNRVSVKQMMDLFVERLGMFAETTGDYHLKIASYSKKISETSDVSEVNLVLDSVMADTLLVQTETKKSHSLMLQAQKEVRDAETRIHELEQKLAEMSEQVHKDQLTGSLNRRGLDDVFEREAARADRRGAPLCVGLLDLDNFKRINDVHGHSTGDEALMHLVKVVKQTVRSMDVIARYGGEEFVIIMPETTLTHAAETMTRVQRELTRHFFMVGNERLLITFSAGVTVRHPYEDQDSVVKRADKAMYAAKKAGKNRVVTDEGTESFA